MQKYIFATEQVKGEAEETFYYSQIIYSAFLFSWETCLTEGIKYFKRKFLPE